MYLCNIYCVDTKKATVRMNNRFCETWTQGGMIPRPSDYESAALTN